MRRQVEARAQQQAQQAYAHPGGAHQQAQAALAYQQAQQAAWLQQQSYSAHYVTAQAQANPTPRPTLRTWILGGIVIVLSLIGAGLMALIIGAESGVLATLVGLLFALIPLVFVLPLFLWLDRFEAEPWRYLATAFLYGAFGSTLAALVLNSLGGFVLMGYTDAESANVLSAVFIAPLTEETFKGLFLLVMWWFMRKEFNGLTDGIVYAGIVAAGFAFTENIIYFGRAFAEAQGAPATKRGRDPEGRMSLGEHLTELRNRGVRDVFFIVCDGLKGLPDSVNAVFPQAIVQACVIHLIRATLRYASRKYWDQLAKDLRRIYTAPSAEAAWAAFEELEEKYPDSDVILIESGGDNLASSFSPELVDAWMFVVDVAGGEKIPRKGGPGITRSDLLVINKTDLAPYVGADLNVMDRDAAKMRKARPFVFANMRAGDGIEKIVEFIIEKGGL